MKSMNTRKDRYEAITKFIPIFEADGFTPGTWTEPVTRDGYVSIPFFEQSEAVSTFVQACYEHEWVLRDFPWPEWAQGPEAHALRDDPGTLARATERQLGQLLTVLIRQDRFVDGALDDAFRSGIILQILKRVQALGRTDA